MALQSSRLAGITLTALGPVQAGLAREKRREEAAAIGLWLPTPGLQKQRSLFQGSAGFFSDYSEPLLFSESEAMPCHRAVLCHQGGYCTGMQLDTQSTPFHPPETYVHLLSCQS